MYCITWYTVWQVSFCEGPCIFFQTIDIYIIQVKIFLQSVPMRNISSNLSWGTIIVNVFIMCWWIGGVIRCYSGQKRLIWWCRWIKAISPLAFQNIWRPFFICTTGQSLCCVPLPHSWSNLIEILAKLAALNNNLGLILQASIPVNCIYICSVLFWFIKMKLIIDLKCCWKYSWGRVK